MQSKSVSQLSLLKDITATIAEKKREEELNLTSIKQTIDLEMRFEMKGNEYYNEKYSATKIEHSTNDLPNLLQSLLYKFPRRVAKRYYHL